MNLANANRRMVHMSKPTNPSKSIGTILGNWRTREGLTQADVAKRLGVSRSQVTEIENGNYKVSVDLLIKIAWLTHEDFSSVLNPGRKSHVVTDTSVVIHRSVALRYLSGSCDFLHVPQVVIVEINGLKDRSPRSEVRRKASRALQEIIDLEKGGKLNRVQTPEGDYQNDDDKIYSVACSIAQEHGSDTVYLLADDKDFKVKGDGALINLQVLNWDEFDAIQKKDEDSNALESQRFFKAVKEHRYDYVTSSAGGNINFNYIDQKSGLAPLHQAVRSKDSKMMSILLSDPFSGKVDINITDKATYEFPPLTHAVQMGWLEGVRMLIAAGANVDEPSSPKASNPYNTPLMVAAWHGHLGIARILVESGACVNQQDRKNGYTALIKAAKKSKPEVVEFLLEKGADTTIRSWEGKSAYDYALTEGRGKMGQRAKELLKEWRI